MQVRVKLYILSFAGFMVNYMLRTDLNIAILAMARQDVTNNTVASFPISPRNLSGHNVTASPNSTMSRLIQPHPYANPPIPQVIIITSNFTMKWWINTSATYPITSRIGTTRIQLDQSRTEQSTNWILPILFHQFWYLWYIRQSTRTNEHFRLWSIHLWLGFFAHTRTCLWKFHLRSNPKIVARIRRGELNQTLGHEEGILVYVILYQLFSF